MAAVDDRVVNMQFDNAVFSSKLADTLKELDQLKKSLDFTNSQRGLDDLSKAGNSFNMGDMASKVEGISAKFLALSTIAITALANITSRAVDAGFRIGKAFSFDLAQAGFQEYETKIGSIQTILANTARYGTQLPEVTANLDKLNEYADKTIYSFGQMTSNIGLFTNAGIRVGDATSMIKGFSNAAAASGTNAEGAASAAYQLSQALSAGQIRLMDWRSLTNVGMGNQNMKDSLIEIADKMGEVSKAGLKGSDIQKDFNASLEKGWLTADVMSKYLKIMSGDMDDAAIKALGFSDAQVKAFRDQQKTAEDAATKVRTLTQLIGTVKEAIGSGWGRTFEIVLGNFDTATTLFTGINNVVSGMVDKMSNARNNLLEGWDKLGGRTELINTFSQAWKSLGEILTMIRGEFRTFFPAKTAQDLKNFTDTFAQFVQWLIPAPATLQKMSFVFDGLFGVMDIGWHILKELVLALGNLLGDFRGAGGGALDLAASVGQAILKFDQWLIVGGNLHAFFLKIDHVVDIGANAVKRFITSATAFINEVIALYSVSNQVLDRVGERGAKTESIAGRVATALHYIVDGFEAVVNAGKKVYEFFDQLFFPINASHKVLAQHGETIARQKPLLESLGDILDKIHVRWDAFASAGDKLKLFGEGVVHVLENLWSYLSKWFSELGQRLAEVIQPTDFDAAVDAINVGFIGGLFLMFRKLLKGGDLAKMGKSFFEPLTSSLNQLKGTLKAMETELKAKALEEIAIAIGILAASVLVLSLINSDDLTKAMTALAVGFGQLVLTMAVLDHIASDRTGAAKLTVLATAMNLMATASLVLAGAVALLGNMDPATLAKGMTAVAVGLGIMVATIQSIEGNMLGALAGSAAMIAMATAMTIMAGAIALFGTMSWTTIGKGLLGVAAAITIITVAMNAMPVFSTLAAGAAMIPLATGIVILAGAVKLFATMSWGELIKGFIALDFMLGSIATTMGLMPLTLPLTAAGLLLVATALDIMVPAILLIGHMKLGDLVKSLVGLDILLGTIAAGVNAMDGALPGAAALLVVAIALGSLSKVLINLSKLSWGDLIKGLVAIAAILVVLGLASFVLEPLIPAMLGLGIALTVIGAGFALFGAGAYLFGLALQMIAQTGVVAAKSLVTSLEVLLTAIPRLVGALVASLFNSAGDILNAGQLMLKILAVLLLQLLDTVIQLAPKIAQALVTIILDGLYLMRETFPQVAQTMIDLLIVLLETIDKNMNKVVDKATDVVVHFANSMKDNSQELVDAGFILIGSFMTAIGNRVDDVIRLAAFLLIRFVQSMAENTYLVAEKGVDIVIAFLNAIGDQAVRLARGAAEALVHFLEGLAQAIRDEAPRIRQAGVDVAEALISGMTGGLSDKAGAVVDKIKDVAGGAINAGKKLFGINSPSTVFAEIGRNVVLGLAQGLDANTAAENSAVAQAERIVQAFSETLSRIPDSLEGLDSSPVITPVLDLTKVRDAAAGLDSLLSSRPITPEVSYSQARTLATTVDTGGGSSTPEPSGPSEVKFEQNIYASNELSTNDIYRNTRSQITLAKEELNIR